MLKENHIVVNKTARYYTMGQFSGNTTELWFVLHGFGQNAKQFLEQCAPLATGSKFIIAPEALNRFYLQGHSGKVGATWMTKEDRLNEIKDYLAYLDDLYGYFELEKFTGLVYAMGFSQGASTLTRWVNATSCRIDKAIVYAGEVAPEVLPLAENSGLKKTRNYFICGKSDEIFTSGLVAQMRDAYKELNFTEIEFEGKHELNADVLVNI